MDIRTTSSVAIIALGLLALAGPASAATTLRTDPGGPLLTGSTTITSTSSDGLVVTGFNGGTLQCDSSSFDADVSRNSSATTITGTLTSLTSTSCSGSLVGGTAIKSCALSADSSLPTIHIEGRSTGGLISIRDPTLQCSTPSPTAFCYYTAPSVTGAQLNAQSTLSIPFASFTTTTGTGSLGAAGCGTGGAFSWTFRHIVQGGTSRTVTITTS